jgi:DNA-binding SARP family transcriptional activator
MPEFHVIPARALILLGTFRLSRGTEPVPVPLAVSRLLALLGLHDGVERNRVVDLLWPDLSPQRGQANLRTALWRLQRVVPGIVVSSGELLELPGTVCVDARVVETWALSVIHGQEQPLEWPPLPPSAGRMLLPGWDDPWLVEHRERLHLLQLQAFEVHARHLLRLGRGAEAMWYAFRAMQIDPLRESAAQLTIEIHMSQGNLAEAVRLFDRFSSTLRTELGVEPGPALSEAIARCYPRVRIPQR